MQKLADIVELIRPYQWYKNLVIFLPIIFGGVLFDFNAFSKTVLGLVSLCCVSSFNYVINDIMDKDYDKNHPEKKTRPLACNKIKIGEALIVAFLLLLISLAIALSLSRYFVLCILALVVLTQLYTFYFKNEVILDIILIALNFVIRSVSGAVVILTNNKPYISISSWLILCTFFLSLFISVGKRESDLIFLGKNAKKHKEVLGYYRGSLTQAMMIITTSSLIISYSLYSFLSVYKSIILTLPIAMYAIFRYLFLIYQGSDIARHPHKIFNDKKITLSACIWVLFIVILVYLV